MLPSTWCILIGGGGAFGVVATLLAIKRRSFTEVVIVGAILLSNAILLNDHYPPWGAIGLFALLGFVAILTIVFGMLTRRRGAAAEPVHRGGSSPDSAALD